MVSEMRWCPQCRQPLQAGYVFCPGCGAQLGASPSGMVQPTSADHLGRDLAVPKPRSSKGLLVFLCVLAGVVAIFVLHSAFKDATSASGHAEPSVTSAESSQSASPSTNTTRASSESSGQSADGQNATAPSSSVAARVKHVGDTVSAGYWSYCVNGQKWTPYINNLGEVERANADFLILDISTRNDDTSASTLPPVKLLNDDGEEFSESSIRNQGFLDTMTTLNPHVATRGLIAFDAPVGHYRVELSGGFNSDEKALVDLVDSGSSTTPQTTPANKDAPQSPEAVGASLPPGA
jgi:Domain of unknown function (DUF4352)